MNSARLRVPAGPAGSDPGTDPTGIWGGPEPRRFQGLWFAIALVAIFPGVAAASLYLLPPKDDASALTASFIPYGMIADLISLVFFGIVLVRANRRLAVGVLTMISALLLTLQLIWIMPVFVPNPRPVDSRPFTVMSLNTKLGGANVDQVRRQAQRADVVVLVEVTPGAYWSLRSALAERFPNIVPAGIPTGTQSVILSRYPLTETRELRSENPQWSAATTIPGVGPVNLIAAHPCNPLCGGEHWRKEHTALRHRAEDLDRRPEVIAGDFNATDDQVPMRKLVDHGFVSAADITGAGWMPTFPSDSRIFPPLINIDHVLVNHRLTALSISTFRVDGTDHLGLLARLAGTDG
jgi:endonuclease/exonuclease/phosphatase (EEP) superfamily protein YafD